MSMTACIECGKTIDCSRDAYVVCTKCERVFCNKCNGHVGWHTFVCKECGSSHVDVSELVAQHDYEHVMEVLK
jgi:primosomal protein N'